MPWTRPFQRYVALRDSNSIDEYPALDCQEAHGLEYHSLAEDGCRTVGVLDRKCCMPR